MGLLTTCEQCGCTYMPGTACPNCKGGAAGSATAEDTAVMTEYARRKEKHTWAYAAYMGRGMAGGLAGLIGAVFFLIMLYRGWRAFSPLVLIPTCFGLLFAGGISAVSHMFLQKNKEFLEIHCPACDARLDELPMDSGYCPGCNVKVAEKSF